ncbi:hypothetical protein F4819DRAFT_486732 [Hypoxylon fuscum]|nr:hypothetical protein F4819DRAFT_486732 [Hypoxylon fuscum]
MAMSKKTTFTTISPLPAGMTRAAVISFLHNHVEMIDLNPLVIERHPIPPPAHAPPEEQRCTWWSMTDKISYLPGGVVTGDITYTAAFHDLPDGIQTHCYAPMGTDIRERWSLNGNLPGEPPQPVELGIGAPRQGLYLREDVELRCNFVMSSFVKKTLKKAHGTLVDRLLQKSQGASSSSSASQGASQSQNHRHAGSSSVHSGSAHSNRSSNHSPYPAASSQYAAPYQPQPQPRSASGSPLYGHATSPPPGSSAAPYGHGHGHGRGQSQGQGQRQEQSHGHSPAPSAGSHVYMPEPLRVNRNRQSSGPYNPGQGIGAGAAAPQRLSQMQNGAWSSEKHAYDPHAPGPHPARGGGRTFAAELE